MDEIIDLEEVTVEDETLKDFMKKDEEAEKELSNKINDLASEEEKITKKEEELKSLEEKSREKITTNASADELIEIAGKIKEVEEELSSIKENIDKLSKEKEELINTKNEIESSKKEYIKSLNKASSNYKEQLQKITEAIEVCDNPTLKQVLEDVQNKKNEELEELQEKRVNELKKVLKEEDETKVDLELPEEEPSKIEEKPQLEISTEPVSIPEPVVETPIEMPKIDDIFNDLNVENQNVDTPTVETPTLEQVQPVLDIPVSPSTYDVPNEVPVLETTPTLDLDIKNNTNDNDIINLDSILNFNSQDNLNTDNTNNMVIPEISPVENQNKNKTRIIYSKEVPSSVLKEIYSSSRIMPSLNSYLDNNEGSFI